LYFGGQIGGQIGGLSRYFDNIPTLSANVSILSVKEIYQAHYWELTHLAAIPVGQNSLPLRNSQTQENALP